MNAGDLVRLIDNPSRLGTLTSHRSGKAPREKALVNFNDGKREFQLLSALEAVEDKHEVRDAHDLMAQGRYGRAADLRGAITHYRLNGKLANLIYSLNTTNTQFLPYQFKPVLQFLESPSNGIVIADEVGLGKTIEAGLIWTEMRARQDAKRLLVVCPAMLKPKWIDELGKRFGVKAIEVDAEELTEHLAAVRDRPMEGFALVASIQGMRPPKGWHEDSNSFTAPTARLAQLLHELGTEEPLVDLVVIDEAHYLRNETTQTHKFARLLRPVTQSLVMLSATPIQMRSKDLFNLLNLLDEDAFPYEFSYERNVMANAPLVALRDRILRSNVKQEEFLSVVQGAKTWFKDSEQIAYLCDHPPTDERLADLTGRAELADLLDRINPLGKVVNRTLKRDVQELRIERDVKLIRVEMNETERRFYDAVTDAVADFCASQDMPVGFMLTLPQRQMVSCMSAACKGWADKSKGPTAGRASLALETLTELGIDQELDDSTELVVADAEGPLTTALRVIAQATGNHNELASVDTKLTALKQNLTEYWRQNPNKKVVLFSFYRNTLYYLRDQLAEIGVDALVLHGGMDKQAMIQQFERSNGPRMLLSSEVASEGVDLQFSSLVINYDLPWNPAKIEQRIGRIDRIGQEADRILIWNLVFADTIDDRVYELLFQRLQIFQRALGSMEAVLGDEIRKLSYELLSHKLTPEQEAERIEKSYLVLVRLDREQKRLEEEATQLIAHGDFIQNKVKAAETLGRYIQGSDLLVYVSDYLSKTFAGTDFIATGPEDLAVRPNLSADCRAVLGDFLEDRRLQGRTAVLAHPPPTLLFDNRHGKPPYGIEKVTQDHPLVRFVGEHQRRQGATPNYYPAVAVELSSGMANGIEPGNYVFVVMRWTVSGSRDFERLEYRSVNLRSGAVLDGDTAEQFVNAAALIGNDWLGTASIQDHGAVAQIQDNCRAELEDQFYFFRDSHKREDADRIRMMIQSLEHQLNQKRAKTEENIRRFSEPGNERQRRLIPMAKGTLRKLELSIETRIAQLRNKEKLAAEQSMVCSGVIRVV